jgi:hypothetical protein
MLYEQFFSIVLLTLLWINFYRSRQAYLANDTQRNTDQIVAPDASRPCSAPYVVRLSGFMAILVLVRRRTCL